MTAASVSAIVVTYNTGARLKECLYALSADPEVGEIVIVNNGNPQSMVDWMDGFAQSRPDVVQLMTDTNIGFGAAANIGVYQAKGSHVLIINPDAVLRWKSVSPMLEAMEGCPEPCLVGGRIFGLDGVEQRGSRRRMLTLPRALGLSKWTLEDEPALSNPVEMECVSGALFMMTRAAFLDVGGFDEGYFLHVEDIDLCRRVWASGGKVIYQPAAAALHYGQTSDAPSAVVAAHKADSTKRYFNKFASGPLEKILLALLLPLISWRIKSKAR